jgi:CMP-N,N'-diacetyllegionaminic acid synthase
MPQTHSAHDAEILALIPARGGSKGIPRKNILPIAGKPAIAYSIEQARQSRYIKRVIVSTDSPEVADVARRFGAEVPFLRPGEYAGDLSPDIDVFRHALTHLRDRENYHCDYIVHLRPPTILRCVDDIDEAIELMVSDPEAETLRSVCPATLSPYKMWVPSGKYMTPLLQHPEFAEPQSMPRQILPQVYWQNGYVDIIRSDVILKGRMTGDKVLPFVVIKNVPELDYAEDIERLEKWIAVHGPTICPSRRQSAVRHAV